MEGLEQLEGRILLWIQEYVRQDWLDPIMVFLTSLGNAGWFWLLLMIVMLFFVKTRRIGSTGLLAIGMGAIITNLWLKNIVDRIRPYEVIEGLHYIVEMPSDASFPSGHATCSMAAAVVLFCKLPGKFKIPSLMLGVLISLSRLYVGVHFPTDVLAGMAIGTIAALAAMGLVKKLCLQFQIRQ